MFKGFKCTVFQDQGKRRFPKRFPPFPLAIACWTSHPAPCSCGIEMKKYSQLVNLSAICIDGGTQQREKISMDDVEYYAEAMRCGSHFPAVTLFFDGVQHWLADGFHRYHACKAAEIPTILADVLQGTKREALLFSFGANDVHGIRRTNADKRKSVVVMLDDKEWRHWVDPLIAKHCRVSSQFVAKLRKELFSEPEPAAEDKKYDKTTCTPSYNKPSDSKASGESENDNPPKQTAHDKAWAEPVENNHEPAEPEYTEMDAAQDQIAYLQDALATAHLDGTAEEKALAGETIKALRAEVKTLSATLSAVKASRDSYQQENAELRAQCRMHAKEIKKLKWK